MYTIDAYLPTKIVFGNGRVKELATLPLPGRKALLCQGPTMHELGFTQRVTKLLQKNDVSTVLFDQVKPNPTKSSVMAAAALAKEQGCDFVIGLGGGSSIDAAKAIAILIENGGDLWDYASVGTGGRQAVTQAAPVVAITTTSGTGTETDPYAVITNESTQEKLDFALDAIYPAISIIDPELMVTVPRDLTVYQGFDALFHALECYISNENVNRLVDLFAKDSIATATEWLPRLYQDSTDLEARNHLAYAANILSGYTQALINTTSLHILAQTMGGLFPALPHGAALIMLAEAYFEELCRHRPQMLEDIGSFMQQPAMPGQPGRSFVHGLTKLMNQTGVGTLAMSAYGISPKDFPKIVDITVDLVGIDFEKFALTKSDLMSILERSYR